MTQKLRILIASFPARGHMNPALSLADRLAGLGCDVTFVTTVSGFRQAGIATGLGSRGGVTFVSFSDGHDEGLSKMKGSGSGWDKFVRYSDDLRRTCSEAIRGLVRSRSINCLVYTLIMPWVSDVAAEFEIPAALLWVQCATSFVLHHHYFHGSRHKIVDTFSSGETVRLSGLEDMDLAADDFPTIFKPDVSSGEEQPFMGYFRDQFEVIDRDESSLGRGKARVLVNTCDGLEGETLTRAESRLIAVGPLSRDYEKSNEEFRCSAIGRWLDAKEKKSVVFVCFGTVVPVSRVQKEEMAKGLLSFGQPFLWVDRKEDKDEEEDEEENISYKDNLEGLGLVVPWCNQVKVLRHVAVSCFVSHCGWNSTLESLTFGVPVVAVPQSVDQTTNAKLVEDVWKTGVRARPSESGDCVVFEGEEIKRCLEAVIGGEKFARNAEKWRDVCREANVEGGSSDQNLKAFVAELTKDKNFYESI